MFLLFIVIFWKLNSWCRVRCKRCWGGWSIARPCSPPSSSWRRSIPIGQLLSTRLEWRWDFVFGEFLISLQVLCMWYNITMQLHHKVDLLGQILIGKFTPWKIAKKNWLWYFPTNSRTRTKVECGKFLAPIGNRRRELKSRWRRRQRQFRPHWGLQTSLLVSSPDC